MDLYLKVKLKEGQFSSENWITFQDYLGGEVKLARRHTVNIERDLPGVVNKASSYYKRKLCLVN